MLAAVRRGNRVVTGGGIIGTVAKVGPDDELSVEIAEGVRVKIVRSTITSVLAKTEPAKGSRARTAQDEEADAEGAGTAAPTAPGEPERTGLGRFVSRTLPGPQGCGRL